jgi:hypothetical protein
LAISVLDDKKNGVLKNNDNYNIFRKKIRSNECRTVWGSHWYDYWHKQWNFSCLFAGFLGGAVIAIIYNFALGEMGGIKVELEVG